MPLIDAETPEMTLEQAQSALEALRFARVSEESIKDHILSVDYLTHGITTIAVITMFNGFKVFGNSTPASPKNYSAEIGKRYAFENAFRNIWQLEGYRLRSELHAHGL